MAVTKELLQMDLYALLGIEEKAADKEVKKAYRQKALSCHPDKNPDNPRAAELFHQLSQALEVLTDSAARAAYDKVRKAKKQAAERTQKLDEKRKKVKLDLEAREQQAQAQGSEEEEECRSSRTLEQEIERLREEGSRQLEEQQRLIREQIRKEREQRLRGKAENPEDKGTPKLKLKWKCKKEDESKGGYSRDVLLRLFQKTIGQSSFSQTMAVLSLLLPCASSSLSRLHCSGPPLPSLEAEGLAECVGRKEYGEVLNLVLSSKKTGTAVVEFATVKAAELAVQNEVGLVDNPLKISWLEGRPQGLEDPRHPGMSQGSVLSERDYESLVMMRMRQAAERQQLIAQMQQEDKVGQPT
ncbi:dnaJ homolog subfamily C member 17 isoform X1 [Rousettus aegyptiacus]|uniref:DnaJ homolog subfamily C member 17 n=1 Tax=Rousettus aegyptiacus TaxID=9407 RepID=A0A7J8IHH3_ROUAE|nr:dnaJ homolog subfamily C member 17 isoform X1 [Rousettus aegyptiacus]KAF6484057.1 DnaJ heat shock protein family (Hsp40) member C17 [Rousettus aegyptiacus]